MQNIFGEVMHQFQCFHKAITLVALEIRNDPTKGMLARKSATIFNILAGIEMHKLELQIVIGNFLTFIS